MLIWNSLIITYVANRIQNICHIFYYKFSFIFLQIIQKRPQKSLHTKILSVTSSVNHCLITMQKTKDTGMRPPERLPYPYIVCIIPTQILAISMEPAMLGRFYPFINNKGTTLPLFWNLQVMFSLGKVHSSLFCLLQQWLTDDVRGRILVWKLFCGRF